MRFALFGDVHSNLEAFNAVIDAYKEEKIDAYFSVGDIIGYGPDPIGCVALLKEINAFSIAGNHEWGVLGLSNLSNFTENAAKSVIWTKDNITDSEYRFLKSLELIFENDYFMLVHASIDNPDKFYYIYNSKDTRGSFDLLKRQVCFIGHTHRPVIFRLQDGKILTSYDGYIKIDENCRYIVNVGSVGQPRDGDNRASFCIYDSDKKEILIKRVSYDFKKTQTKILKTTLPESFAYRLG